MRSVRQTRVLVALAAIALATLAPVRAADDGGTVALFAEANGDYEKGDFEAAAARYRALLDSGARTPTVYYNLGNAEYRQDRRGEAALAYARALALDPSHAEARQNLRFLKRKTGLLEFGESGFARFGRQFADDHVAVFLASAGWICVLSVAALVLFKPRRLRLGLALSLAVLGLLGSVAGGVALAARHFSGLPDDLAIVRTEDARAMTAPATSATAVITLPPGSEVRVLARRGSWAYVAIPGDLRGWVDSAAIAGVSDYESAGKA